MNSKVHQLFILLLVGNDGPGLYGFLFLAKTLKSIYLALILLSKAVTAAVGGCMKSQ